MTSPASFLGRMLSGRRADERRSIIYSPELRTADLEAGGTLAVTSPDFSDGDAMPLETTSYGANQSPALAWSAVPDGTAQLLLIMEDIDVPIRKPMIHTIALLDPSVTTVPRGGLAATSQRFVKGPIGRPGYHGPRPIPGHGAHRYRFHLYALDATVPESARTIADLLPAVAGHVLASGTVTGTYRRD